MPANGMSKCSWSGEPEAGVMAAPQLFRVWTSNCSSCGLLEMSDVVTSASTAIGLPPQFSAAKLVMSPRSRAAVMMSPLLQVLGFGYVIPGIGEVKGTHPPTCGDA